MAHPPRAGLALLLLTLVYTLNFVDRQVITILIVPIQDELHVSDTAMGALAGLYFALLFTLAGIPIARWADRGVRRDVLALGLLVWSGMTAVSALTQNYLQLALARVGVGLGESACAPASHSLISDLFPREQRARALAVYSTGIHLGILCGLVIGGWVSQEYGWRAAFLVAGLPGVLLAVILRVALREPVRARVEPRQDSGSLAELWQNRTLRWIALAGAATSVVGYGFATWTPAFLERVHHLPRAEIGVTLGLISGIAGALGTLSFGALADRLARKDARWMHWVPALALALSIPCYAGFVLFEDAGAAWCSLALCQFLAASWFGPVFASTQNLVRPERRALAAAVLLFVVNGIGLGLGPTLVGWMNDMGSIRHSLLLVLVFELAAVGALLRAARRDERV